VLVSGLAAGVTRHGEHFHREVAVSNGAGAVSAAVSVVASEGSQTVGVANGRQFVAKAVEVLVYDAEGNLTRDGRWEYAWDGENRLMGMESLADAPVESRLRLKFEQDWAGRRVRKRVYAWTGGAGGGYGSSPAVDVKYVWVGWHLAAELNGANNAVVRSYLWGPDAGGGLAGELDGAGGIGGLAGVREGGALRWAALDGQGNVAGLVGAGDGVVSGWYEYGPYGELLRATGAAGLSNPLRHEGKLEDRETGLVYYGFRYYHPGLGRWIGKDPMGESGGLNLYGYVGGDPINGMDPYGLWEWSDLNPFRLLDASQWGKWIYKAAVGEGRRPHDPHSNMGMRNEMGMGADTFDGRSGAELASMIGGAVPAALLGAGLNFAPGAAAAKAGGKASGNVCAIGNLGAKVSQANEAAARIGKAANRTAVQLEFPFARGASVQTPGLTTAGETFIRVGAGPQNLKFGSASLGGAQPGTYAFPEATFNAIGKNPAALKNLGDLPGAAPQYFRVLQPPAGTAVQRGIVPGGQFGGAGGVPEVIFPNGF